MTLSHSQPRPPCSTLPTLLSVFHCSDVADSLRRLCCGVLVSVPHMLLFILTSPAPLLPLLLTCCAFCF